MAATKLMAPLLLLLLLLLATCFTTGVLADGGEEPKSAGSDLASDIKLDQLNAKIRALESQIDEKTRQVKGRQEIVAEKEKLVQDKQDKVVSLETQVSSLRNKDSSDSVEMLEKAEARVNELEKKIEMLKNSIEQKNKEKESTEARTREAEKKLNESNSKLKKIHKKNEEQKNKIRKLERALRSSEEEMLRTKHEATTKAKELLEVHGAWLPPWLAVHWISFQTVAGTHWETHGKPVMEKVTQKVTQAKAEAEKWAEPHMANAKTKYIPSIKETVKTHVEPHMHTLSTKAKEAYHASKNVVTPHFVKLQGHVDPYYQEAKKFSKPYVDQVATAAKPHVDKVRAYMKPYTKKSIHYYKEFLKSATTYHNQVQDHVERKLKSHEVLEPFATKEFIWFTASALLALPAFIVYKLLCSRFRQVPYKYVFITPWLIPTKWHLVCLLMFIAAQRQGNLQDTLISMVVVKPKGVIPTSEAASFTPLSLCSCWQSLCVVATSTCLSEQPHVREPSKASHNPENNETTKTQTGFRRSTISRWFSLISCFLHLLLTSIPRSRSRRINFFRRRRRGCGFRSRTKRRVCVNLFLCWSRSWCLCFSLLR